MKRRHGATELADDGLQGPQFGRCTVDELVEGVHSSPHGRAEGDDLAGVVGAFVHRIPSGHEAAHGVAHERDLRVFVWRALLLPPL